MNRWCQFCQVVSATKPDEFLCDHCSPTCCSLCGSKLQFDESDREWKCIENNHSFDSFDVMDELYENRLDYDLQKRIQFGGARTEAIVSNSDSIKDIQQNASDLEPDDNDLVLYHSTRNRNVDDIVDNGLKTLSELGKEDELNESYKGSIRYDAVFGWPFKPDAGPNDYEFSEFVYFTVPFDSVVISTYSYLEYVQYGYISLDVYEKKYCFNPEEFVEVCEGTGRPYRENELLISEY